MSEGMSAGEQMVDDFLREARVAAPDEVADVVARCARKIGAADVVLYLVDLQQVRLVPVPSRLSPAREPLVIDATVGGRVFRTLSTLDTEADGGRRVWLPLLDAVERLGVLELTVDALDEPTLARCHWLASLAAEAIVSKRAYSDTFAKITRSREMSLAAEVQNILLPPLTSGTERVVASGLVEPAYNVGGDVFDVTLGRDDASVAIFDAVGHDLAAGLISSVAVGGFRNSRRAGEGLPAIATAIDRAIDHQFGAARFATGVLAHLDLGTGSLAWVNCGHPAPLLIRDGKVVKTLDTPSGLPLGLGLRPGHGLPETGEEPLQPGDRVLLYTDGVVEARSPTGELFGEDRLADFIIRESAAGMLAPETLRRLVHAILEHQNGRLQDDATILVLEWHGADDPPGPTP